MDIIKFYYCNKEYYLNDTLIFTGTSEFESKRTQEEINTSFVKIIRHPNSYSLREFRKYSDEELINGMVIKELPKPKSFPKFNNEQPFQIKFNNKTLKNPKIIAIRWSGYIWEYQIENIGHKHDFQPESALEKI